jgi:hypothetical protein
LHGHLLKLHNIGFQVFDVDYGQMKTPTGKLNSCLDNIRNTLCVDAHMMVGDYVPQTDL